MLISIVRIGSVMKHDCLTRKLEQLTNEALDWEALPKE